MCDKFENYTYDDVMNALNDSAEDRRSELTDLLNRVSSHMKTRYNVNMQDIELATTPGYWIDKKAKIHHGHPLHSCICCSGPFKATYTYFDNGRDEKGRFESRTKTWAAIKMLQAV